jgi:subtilisin-like proprotein convertase family protein
MRWLVALALVGCSFRTHAIGDGGDDDGPPPAGVLWQLDSAADFSGSGYQTSAITIEPGGLLTPAGYIYGGLVMHGLHGTELWTDASPLPLDFGVTAGVTPGGAALYTGGFFTTSDSLNNVGIATNDVFSLWMEGEVYLDAGDTLTIDADGDGFVDLYFDGSWHQMAYSEATGVDVSVPVTAAGWYPIRIGYGEATGNGFLDVRHGPSGSATPFTRDRLRAVASELTGTMRLQFFHQIFGGTGTDGVPPISHLEAVDLLQALPAGLDVNDFSLRWFGQIHVDQPGTYMFTVDSDDGNQLYAGSSGVATHWVQQNGYSGSTMLGATFDAGWNDLDLDYNQVSGAQRLSLLMNGAPVPVAQLRPVEPRRDRLIAQTVVPSSPVAVTNDTGTLAMLTANVDGYPSEVVTSIDVMLEYTTQHRDQLVVKLSKPGGAPVAIQTHQGTGQATAYQDQIHITDPALVGGAPAGAWIIGLGDDVNGANTTTLLQLNLTLHTAMGPEQIALTGMYVSPVKDLGSPLSAITDVAWRERAPIASEIALRTCDQPDCSDAPAWSAPIDPHGRPALAAKRYLQAQVTMHSDGTKEPELDALAIHYVTQ